MRIAKATTMFLSIFLLFAYSLDKQLAPEKPVISAKESEDVELSSIKKESARLIIHHSLRYSTYQQKEMLFLVIWKYGYLKSGIDPAELLAFIATESEWNPYGRNKYSGATGLMQHLPNLFPHRKYMVLKKRVIPDWYIQKYGSSITEPAMNVACGIWYLMNIQPGIEKYTNRNGHGWFKSWIIGYYSGQNGSKRYIHNPSTKQIKYIERFEGFREKYLKFDLTVSD